MGRVGAWRFSASVGAALSCALVACVGDSPDTNPTSSSSGATSSSGGTSGPTVAAFDFADGCLDWTSSSASLKDDDTAQSPAKSCRVCNNQNEASGYDINRRLEVPLAVNDKFLVSAWVRGPSDATVAGSMLIGLRTEDAQLGTLDQGGGAATTALRTDGWVELRGTLDVTTPNATALRIFVSSQDQHVSCFLVDDVTITRR